MRRQNPASVRIKAPSRGLITRWPGETADSLVTGVDRFNSIGLLNRASTVGSNVRYEDGVVKSAPGYDRVILRASILNDLVAHWRLNEGGGTRFDATLNHFDLTEVLGSIPTVDHVTSVEGKFNAAARFPELISTVCSFDTGLLVNVYEIQGWTDGLVPNPFTAIPPVYGDVYDGTFEFSNLTNFVGPGWHGANKSPTGDITMDGGSLCNSYIEFVGCVGNVCQYRLHFESGGDGTIWSGLLTNNSPDGVYINDNTGADASPSSLTVIQGVGTATTVAPYACSS